MYQWIRRLWGRLSIWLNGTEGADCVDADIALEVFYDAFKLNR
jgi:hypothetical protein